MEIMPCIVKKVTILQSDTITFVIFYIDFFKLQISSVQVEKELVGYKAGEKSRVGDLILPFGGNGLNTDTECLYDVSIYSSLAL